MSIASQLGGLLHIAPYMSFVNDMAGYWRGNKATDETHAAVKVAYGIFSKEDELKVASIILSLPDNLDQELAVGVCQWAFDPRPNPKQPITFQHWLESLIYRNDFFTYLAKLHDKGAPKKKGVERVIKKTKVAGGGEEITTTETDIMSEGKAESEAVKLIKLLVKRIKEELDEINKSASNLTETSRHKRAYERVYKRYYKNDFTTQLRKVGENDLRIWERLGLTEENWKQFSTWATPFVNKGVHLIKNGTEELTTWLQTEADRSRNDTRILPNEWTRDETRRKLATAPRNLFFRAWNKIKLF